MFYIFPGFLRTVLKLKKAKRDFKIVFRSMGRELPDAVDEFNAFCNGKHPAYNGENGTHKVLFNESKFPNLTVKQSNRALYYRLSEDIS